MGDCVGVVMEDSHFSTTCTAVLVTDDGDGAGCCDAVRTYNCFMPHCQCVGAGGLTIVLCLTVMMDL